MESGTNALRRYAVLPLREGETPRLPTLQHGFEARIEVTALPAILDLTFTAARPEIGTNSVVIRGPAPEWLPTLVSSEVAQELGLGERGVSITEERIAHLTQQVAALCRAATAVVQPLANNMASTAESFAADAADFLARRNVVPLWAYPKFFAEDGWPYLETTGMATFGLPEVAMPADAARRPAFEDAAYALMRAMIARGPLPVGAEAQFPFGRLRVEADVHGALWCVPVDQPATTPAVAGARAQLERKRSLGALLPGATHLHSRRSGAVVAKEHFVSDAGATIVTNGASPSVELALRTTRPGPWVDRWLEAALAPVRGGQVSPFDRWAFTAPAGDLAGAIFWPMGHLVPAPAQRVDLLLLVPITRAELQAFRADGAAQTQWIAEREQHRDLHLLEQRWDQVAASP